MLINYFKIALRNIKRHKTFSFVNISGLSISLALVIIITAYIQVELSVNNFHNNYDRIYKVGENNTPAPVADIIKSNLPEIQKAARIENFRTKSVTMKYGNKPINVKDIVFSDPDFFDIFSFQAVMGNPQKALSEPMSLVLTESEAKIIFGRENPINKIIKMNNSFDLVVKAVIKDIPQSSSLQFNGVISFISIKLTTGNNNFDPYSWHNSNYETYILFPKLFNKEKLVNKIESILKKNVSPNVKGLNTNLFPFKDIYYNLELSGISSHGSAEKNIALISVAILILLIAVINFVNLSTARVSARNKETGVRKTIGASRFNLVIQFLSESITISIISIIAAIIITLILSEVFGKWFDFNLSLFPDSVLLRMGIFLIAAVFLGILAGIYPAIYLTSFKPGSLLKGNIYHGHGKSFLRKSLIIFQFAITSVFIISTFVIYKQMEYVRNKPLGYQKENIIYFPVNSEIMAKKDVVQNRILQLSSVEDFSYASSVPGEMEMTWGQNMQYEGKEFQVGFHSVIIPGDFIRLMKMKIIEGRSFIDKDTNDIWNVIINESFAKKYDLKEPMKANLTGMGEGKCKIVGVVKDFYFESLHSQVEPLALFYDPGWMIGNGLIKIKSTKYADINNVIKNLQSIWKDTSPDFPFEYKFLDEALDKQYKAEERFEKLFLCCSLFAIFIACLGLFGLTAYTIEQRTKEISIRKILGATITGITYMLSRQFIILVLISNIIAWPLAYYLMNNWLKEFAYRIDITPWEFLISGVVTLTIALITVNTNAIKAATANPIKSLKYE
jgi:putative ABC transport system permease protein